MGCTRPDRTGIKGRVPIAKGAVFVERDQLVEDLGGLLAADDDLATVLRETEVSPEDAFE